MNNLREEIERIYNKAYPEFCKKFSGALTVELIRDHLKREGIPVSPRDVFIKGLPLEIDLIIPRQNIRPAYNLLYKPENVVAVLEIKYRGAFGSQALENIKANFQRIRQFGKHIRCIYVTVIETRGYRWAVTRKNLGFPAYTLFWYSNKNQEYTQSNDWENLTAYLTQAIG